MKTKAFFLEFSVIFMITFITVCIVSWCWNFFSAGAGTCSWNVAFFFAIIFGVICPMLDMMKTGNNHTD